MKTTFSYTPKDWEIGIGFYYPNEFSLMIGPFSFTVFFKKKEKDFVYVEDTFMEGHLEDSMLYVVRGIYRKNKKGAPDILGYDRQRYFTMQFKD